MRLVALRLFILFTLSSLTAMDLYVSPSGNDQNTGTQNQPLATLEQARLLVQKEAGKQPITVHVADGTYYLSKTLVFRSEDSGNDQNPVIYKAENEGKAILSGGMKLNLRWTQYQDGIFQAETPEGIDIDQLFINGEKQRMARYPNFDATKTTTAYQGFAVDAFSKERAARWQNPQGGYIHAIHKAGWGGYHFIITGKKPDGDVTYEGGWQNNRPGPIHKEFRMVENIFEELDAPNEWFHNSKKNTLYYKPAPQTDLNTAVVEIVRLKHIVEFQGTSGSTVKQISFKGFTIRHAARTFMDTKEPLLRSDWTIYRGGAFLLTGTDGISLIDCEFDQVGGNAIFVSNFNRRTVVKRCHIHHIGASAVCFVGDPQSLYTPLFNYGINNDLSKIDLTPGPKTDNYPSLGMVEDCLIHDFGTVERQTAGVQIQTAMEITVRDASIYNCPRAGINIGNGAWGGHLIERCDVFDTVLETQDHGAFNSWGRDRYWNKAHLIYSQKVVDQNPNLPFLDAIKTTIIRDSRWRCDHGWDIDLDDGSSNYDIYNNLMLSRGLKLREGFRRRAWNNIMVNSGLCSAVWFNNSKDEVFSNIMMTSYQPLVRGEVSVAKCVDKNFYYGGKPEDLKAVQNKFDWDQNSIIGDALFLDPSIGDYRVSENSPALTIGFKNFPMDQFGVKKASLKAIAKTPKLPPFTRQIINSPLKKEQVNTTWRGATLHTIEGDEFTAYGVSQEEGGVAIVAFSNDSEVSRGGLQIGDLIQGVNGNAVLNINQLLKYDRERPSDTLKLKVVRQQEVMDVTFKVISENKSQK